MTSATDKCVVLNSPEQATRWLEPWHAQNKRVGFVPTMGALHEGHLSLIRAAKKDCDVVCASIFVNPLQFNNAHDLDKYPRDLTTDVKLLQKNGCDMVFTGTLAQFFPGATDANDINTEKPGVYAEGLEGEFRPGHFDGVRTIVRRLFEITGRGNAYFGEKDFQQTLVVKQLANEMGYPTIIVCPTLREANGLAMSSRNERLSPGQRQLAGKIFQSLCAAINAWQTGERNARTLKDILHDNLMHPSITIEYADLRDPDNWRAGALEGELESPPQALIAVMIGEVRLIDNTNLGNRELLNKTLSTE